MDAELDEETIRAAVAGEEWAIKSVVAHYESAIDELCTCTYISDNGTLISQIDEAKRSKVIREFIQAIKDFPI